MLFCGLLVAKIFTHHITLHNVVYYFASSSINLFNTEECFRSKTANLTKFYIFCVMHTHCLLFELKSVECRLFQKYAEQNATGQTSVTTNNLYKILSIRAVYIRRIIMWTDMTYHFGFMSFTIKCNTEIRLMRFSREPVT